MTIRLSAIIFLLATIPTVLYAQVTYQATDYAQIGDSLLFSTAIGASGVDFDTTGANVFWDYSSLAYNNQTVQSYFDPSTTGYQNLWCSNNGIPTSSFPTFNGPCITAFQGVSNLATNFLEDITVPQLQGIPLPQVGVSNMIAHQLLQNNNLEQTVLGVSIDVAVPPLHPLPIPFVYEYENIDTIYQFPLQYGAVDSSTSRLVLNVPTILGVTINAGWSINN